MLLIHCPYCGSDRPELEFRYGGQAHVVRALEPSTLRDEQWSEFMYLRANPKGLHAERWRHMGCGRFFNAVRHTVTDAFVTTYKAGESMPDLARFSQELG